MSQGKLKTFVLIYYKNVLRDPCRIWPTLVNDFKKVGFFSTVPYFFWFGDLWSQFPYQIEPVQEDFATAVAAVAFFPRWIAYCLIKSILISVSIMERKWDQKHTKVISVWVPRNDLSTKLSLKNSEFTRLT